MTGLSKYGLWGPEKEENYVPMREQLKRWYTYDSITGQTLLKIKPDDHRGLLLLLKTMLVRHEITNTGKPIMRITDWWNLSASRAFLPIIDLLIRHPEMIDNETFNEPFLRMLGTPADPQRWYEEEPEALESERQAAISEMLRTALTCDDLTEAECLRYAQAYLDLPEDVWWYPSQNDLLVEHQQKHRAALVALMKARMAAAPEDSAAYGCAEAFLEKIREEQ